MMWRKLERALVDYFHGEGWFIARIAVTGDFVACFQVGDDEKEINLTVLAKNLELVPA